MVSCRVLAEPANVIDGPACAKDSNSDRYAFTSPEATGYSPVTVTGLCCAAIRE
jgi:hypothetical protein